MIDLGVKEVEELSGERHDHGSWTEQLFLPKSLAWFYFPKTAFSTRILDAT